LGSGPWAYPAQWLKEWFWTGGPESIGGGTLVFFDDETGVLVGFVAWRLRKEKVRGRKEVMGQIHLMGIIPAYQGKQSVHGRSLASEMFATAEKDAIEHEKGSDDMPFRIDADNNNVRAREIYEHWGFEYWRPFMSKSGRKYAQLWRPPSEPEQGA
jgi:ribosomal protein S18 acetylase RimI-like enzyme